VGGEILYTHPNLPWDPPNLQYNGHWVSFPGAQQPGRGIDHPPPSSGKIKERAELYLYFPLWAFMACSRVNFIFCIYLGRK